MDKCCATCYWRDTDHLTGGSVCTNYASECCTDQVGDDWHYDGWEVKEDG